MLISFKRGFSYGKKGRGESQELSEGKRDKRFPNKSRLP